MRYQHTIRTPMEAEGVGLHTGVRSRLRLLPAPAGSGIVFQRTDLENFHVEAVAANIARVSYATSLMKTGVLVSTTEHLLAALYAFGLDNVIVELDNLEVPILDGSARPFAELVAAAGRVRQRRRRHYLQVVQSVEVVEGDPASPQARRIAIYPAPNATGLSVDYQIDFSHPLINHQQLRFTLTPTSFVELLSGARTFCFYEEVEQLREMGLIRGGSLDCAVVLTRDSAMNPEGLRYPDEFCRHKALDLIGDLALIGRPLIGHIVAQRGGHALHTALVLRLLRTPSAWREVRADQLASDKVLASETVDVPADNIPRTSPTPRPASR
ncbi:MAG: UDP-3-O-acyl-N-acetylglucosamine deacetylase [Acidobacteria bacterium]|nr:UDP-3-O-acyl-N-acetylglucosamine deacetylase [Acidobacteriota bacterium]